MRIVVTGSTGQLGHHLVEEVLAEGKHELFPWGRTPVPARWEIAVRPVELTDRQSIESALNEADPEVILHAAAVSTADAVRRDPELGWAVNVESTRVLADWCRSRGRRILFTSTDMVFDGERGWYREEEPPNPLVGYGRNKAAAEAIVREVPDGLVARLSLLYGPSRSSRETFFDRSMKELSAGRPKAFFEDEFRTPLDYTTAARILVRLASSPVQGIIHVAGRERLSRYELMRRASLAMGLDPGLVRANRIADARMSEPRPRDLSMVTTRLESTLPDVARPSVEEALRDLA